MDLPLEPDFYKSISISIPFNQLVLFFINTFFYLSPYPTTIKNLSCFLASVFFFFFFFFYTKNQILSLKHFALCSRSSTISQTTISNYSRHFPGGSVSKLSLSLFLSVLRLVTRSYINARKSFEMYGSIRDAVR